jgi:hypothetical protein
MVFGIHTGYFKRLKQLNVVLRITEPIDDKKTEKGRDNKRRV